MLSVMTIMTPHAQIKDNTKAPRHWPLWGEFTGEFPAQRASNAEKVSIWWRHNVLDVMTSHALTSNQFISRKGGRCDCQFERRIAQTRLHSMVRYQGDAGITWCSIWVWRHNSPTRDVKQERNQHPPTYFYCYHPASLATHMDVDNEAL